MEDLVTPHPKTLKMKRRKNVIRLRNPLRHTVIVRVFSLEGEFQIGPVDRRSKTIGTSQASVRAQLGEFRASIANEPQPHVLAMLLSGSSENRPDHFIIQVGSANCQLGLFQLL